MDPASAIGRGVANRLLEDEAWAREKLRAHAGRSFAVASGPLKAAFVVRDDGSLDAAPAGAPPADVELYVSPLDLPALLAQPSRWDTLVAGNGDAALAATLKELAHTLPWFVERAFARVFGPVVGQRLADTGRRLLAFPEYAGERLAESVVSYARDEAGLLARGDEARMLAAQNADLATRVASIAERLEALERLADARPAVRH
ncbi:MAG TPA: hypothetical protein VF196_05110 [Casimicrobiaceae bacterium]